MRPGTEEALGWAREQAAGREIGLTGEIEVVHERPSSVVWRLSAEPIDLYLKAVPPALKYEVALTTLLAGWSERGPDLVAADDERRWLLLRDGGMTLRQVLRAGGGLALWHDVLAEYARLQVQLTGHVAELLNVGCPDRRLALLPGLFEALLEDLPALGPGTPEGIPATERDRLLELAPVVRSLCGELVVQGIPETIQHDDLHDGNVFLRPALRFVDWGDSCVAHPFYSLVIVLHVAAHRFELPEGSPELGGLCEAYLKPWSASVAQPRLWAAFEQAQCLGALCRALTWWDQMANLDDPHRAGYAGAVAAWLRRFSARLQERSRRTK
jgi:hypothetical protein